MAPVICLPESLFRSATATFSANGRMRRAGLSLRAEFHCRERHGMKDAARIIVFRRDTFLIRHGIFGSIHKELSGTHDTNHGKQADRNGKVSAASVTVIQNSVELGGYPLGNITSGATAATFSRRFQNLYAKNKRFDNVYYCGRYVLCSVAGLGFRAIIAIVNRCASE